MVASDGMKVAQGSFGVVYIGEVVCEYGNAQKMAFKVQKDRSREGNWNMEKQLWSNEAELGMLFNHSYMLKIFDSSELDDGMGVMAMEAATTDLDRHFGGYPFKNGVSEAELAEFTLQILWGLKYMHENEYAHADLKTEQVLLRCESNSACEVRIGDFGMSVPATLEHPFKGFRGSLTHMAPEIAVAKSISPASDMWAWGVSLHEMLNRGNQLVPGSSRQLIMQNLKNMYLESNKDDFDDSRSFHYSEKLRHTNTSRNRLLHGLLKFKPQNRVTATSAIELAKQWAEDMGVSKSKIDAIMLKGSMATGCKNKCNVWTAQPPACWQKCKNEACGENFCESVVGVTHCVIHDYFGS